MNDIWKHNFKLFYMGSREKECIYISEDIRKEMIGLLQELKQSYEDNTDRVLDKIDEMKDCFEK